MANPRSDHDQDHDLPELVEALVESYRSDARAHHINRRFLPSRDEIVEIVGLLMQLMYPGYFGRQDLTAQNLPYHVGVTLSRLRDMLQRQIGLCLCYQRELVDCGCELATFRSDATARTGAFLRALPRIRAMLLEDVQAAYDGDPAAMNLDEVILAYPGLLAISVYRLAHELHELGVPLMPRIMTEWAHSKTGADIHPGAQIGRRFFLDHATGAVIGETTRIGSNVKLYQGVTLGALSHPKDDHGRVIRGQKRHPTVDDGVTIYANATVLGGDTEVGQGALVGGSVFLTHSVPAGSRVALKPPELRVKLARVEGEQASGVTPAPPAAHPTSDGDGVEALTSAALAAQH